jgi:hypothetical protein
MWDHRRPAPHCPACLALQVAAGGGTGAVCFAAVVELQAEDGRLQAVLEDSRRVAVHDVLGGGREELEFRDRVVHLALGGCPCCCGAWRLAPACSACCMLPWRLMGPGDRLVGDAG